MGQVLELLREHEEHRRDNDHDGEPNTCAVAQFPCLSALPPELSFIILSNLNATDLCLAGCVWDNLCRDEVLWQG